MSVVNKHEFEVGDKTYSFMTNVQVIRWRHKGETEVTTFIGLSSEEGLTGMKIVDWGGPNEKAIQWLYLSYTATKSDWNNLVQGRFGDDGIFNLVEDIAANSKFEEKFVKYWQTDTATF